MRRQTPAVNEAAIREHLRSVLNSRPFARSKRLQRFLTYVVDAKLAQQEERIQEYAIGVDVFDRGDAFDPKADSIVRSEARRLRQRLEEYYAGEGRPEAPPHHNPAAGVCAGNPMGDGRDRAEPGPGLERRRCPRGGGPLRNSPIPAACR